MFVDQLNDPEEYKEMGILLTDKEGHFVSLDFWNDYIDALIFPLFHVLAQPGFRAHIKLEEAKIKKTAKKTKKTTESQRQRIFVPEDVTQDGNSLYRFGTFKSFFRFYFLFYRSVAYNIRGTDSFYDATFLRYATMHRLREFLASNKPESRFVLSHLHEIENIGTNMDEYINFMQYNSPADDTTMWGTYLQCLPMADYLNRTIILLMPHTEFRVFEGKDGEEHFRPGVDIGDRYVAMVFQPGFIYHVSFMLFSLYRLRFACRTSYSQRIQSLIILLMTFGYTINT